METVPASPPPARAPRAEARLLLHACAVAPLPGDDAPAAAVHARPDPHLHPRPDTDWAWLLEAAGRHGVTPLLARYAAGRPGDIPPGIAGELRARFDRNALRNLRATGALTELLQRLASHAVDAMPIKGPALAISAYGDLALREFADLDVVVRARDFDRARALFAGWGYHPVATLTSAGERALRASDHHLPLVNADAGLVVELHWSLDNRRPGATLDENWIWSNARRVSLMGSELPALSWSALLVYLCVHGAKHGWTRLGWVRDVAGVLRAAPRGELAAAARVAAGADARRRLALGVWLARELLGAPARDDLELYRGAVVAELGRQLRSGLFAGEDPALARWIAFQCRSFDGVRDRVGYCWHLLSAPHVADVEALKLPRWLNGMYYLLRPARLLAKSARALVRTRS